MKKIISFLIMSFVLISVSLVAQPCTPGTYSGNGVFPDSTTGLPPAYINTVYSTVITVKIPTDTIMNFNGTSVLVQIDSIGISSITGLPSGFIYESDPTNAYIHGGAIGCLVVTGTPTSAQIGSYPLTVVFDMWVNGLAQGIAESKVGYYTIHIIDPTVHTATVLNENVKAFNFPNPFETQTTISFFSEDKQVNLLVFNSMGQKVYDAQYSTTQGNNNINLEFDMPNGVYYYTIEGTHTHINNTMIIQK